MNSALMFSKESDEWPTPLWLFDSLNREFGFTLDPCSNGENSKCENFYTIADSPLLKDWGSETVYMNPPYSGCKEWMAKAFSASREGATVVCLVSSRTDTSWWHSYAMKGEVRFIKGRLKFEGAKHNAPFPSAIVVFRPSTFVLRSV